MSAARNSQHKKGMLIMKSILKGKVLYITTAAALTAAAAAGFFAYNSMQKADETELPELLHGEAAVTEPVTVTQPPVTEADVIVTGVPEAEVSAAVTVPDAEKDIMPTEAPSYQPMVRPVNGEIIGSFSNGELVKSTTLNVWKTHDGVDIRADAGATVKSMSIGTVTEVRDDPMWGVCVVIDHGNGIEGHYYGLDKTVSVKTGDTVSAGSVIGAVGSAEAEIAEPSHLHFGVKQNGSWIDPASVVSSIGS